MKACKNALVILLLLFAQVFFASEGMAATKHGDATGGPDRQLQLSLVTLDPGNIESVVDGMLVRYNSGYLTSTLDDNEKIPKSGENIASYREAKDISEERRPFFYPTDTIFLHISNTDIRNYRFKITMLQFDVTGLMVRLDDNYLHTGRILDASGGTNNVDFSITVDPASADPFRFRIVFVTASSLPVTLTTFAATQQGKNIALEWKVSNQLNMLQYEVERSTNGINFSHAATQPAVSNSSSHTYNWLDEHATAGTNFYRIRCVGITGDISYSIVISVKTGSTISGITIYPNPVVNNTIALQFTNMPKAVYSLRLLNNTGQIIFTKTIDHNGSNSTQTLTPESSMAKGNYYLEVKGPGDVKMSKLVLVTK
jgi:hypothetical protein